MTDSSGDNDGPLSFSASPPVPIGRSADARVVQVVGQLLAASDHAVEQLRARDDRGEDGLLRVDGLDYAVQVTGVPQAPKFWARVSQGSATTTATLQEVASWLEGAIDAKLAVTPPQQRPATILALDAHGWADRIVDPKVVLALSSCGLNPAQRHGLAGLAITGLATSNSTWLPGQLR